MNRTERRVIVVSNRLPLSLRRRGGRWTADRSSGGLVTALEPLMKERDGLWVGWPGDVASADTQRALLLAKVSAGRRCVPVELSAEEVAGFYHGYSNRTLWPVFHHFPSRLEFSAEDWEGYRTANEKFANAVRTTVEAGDLIWVHDYHLMLVPALLRKSAPEAAVGFFLHTSFPPAEAFRLLPHREELLAGILGADSIAFQTDQDLRHFRETLHRVLNVSTEADGLEHEGRRIRLDVAAVGIPTDEFSARIGEPGIQKRVREVRSQFADSRLILAVDRLDYTKGIPHRLRAFRLLLERHPELREQVTLLQVAVPSRERIPGYARLSQQVNELVGSLNGDMGTTSWTPVRYVRQSVARDELLALYAAADIAWVAPLRDGMNLVAKEYAACHPRGDGVLVLSEFAGAADELSEALLVNPYDEGGTAQTIEAALRLDGADRSRRMRVLHGRVLAGSARTWSEGLLARLAEAADDRGSTLRPTPLPVERAVSALRSAERRLVLVDYDGTLVPFATHPSEAVPTEGVVYVLTRLARLQDTAVALVSGRGRSELEAWFGDVPGLWLGAEHGALLRNPQTRAWEPLHQRLPQGWKARALSVLEPYAAQARDSFIEDKSYSLVWHYRSCPEAQGEAMAPRLIAELEQMRCDSPLRVVPGNMSVEVRLACVSKSGVGTCLADLWGHSDSQLAIGDDLTDEDMFEALPAAAWTVHVGGGPSQARFRLGTPAEAVTLLERLATELESKWAATRRDRASSTVADECSTGRVRDRSC